MIDKPVIMKNKKWFWIMLLMGFMTLSKTNAGAVETNKAITEARITQIKTRVSEIQAMDVSHMTKADRIVVRHEMKNMNKELHAAQPYIFISVGALIVIIALLIILT